MNTNSCKHAVDMHHFVGSSLSHPLMHDQLLIMYGCWVTRGLIPSGKDKGGKNLHFLLGRRVYTDDPVAQILSAQGVDSVLEDQRKRT